MFKINKTHQFSKSGSWGGSIASFSWKTAVGKMESLLNVLPPLLAGQHRTTFHRQPFQTWNKIRCAVARVFIFFWMSSSCFLSVQLDWHKREDMLQHSHIYLQLSVCFKILAKHLGWRKEVTNHLKGGKRRMRISITNYLLGSPTPKTSWCYTRMWEKKAHSLCVSNCKSNIHIQNLHEHHQFLKFPQVTLEFQSSLNRTLDKSFLQTLEKS